MAKGKQTCKILKEIRRQIAAENDIKLVIEECTYHGDCLGTCPKCEAEVRYLERELEKRQRMGKAAMVAGLSVGLMAASQTAFAQQPDAIVTDTTDIELQTLRGAVDGVIGSVRNAMRPITSEEMMELFDWYEPGIKGVYAVRYIGMPNLRIVGVEGTMYPSSYIDGNDEFEISGMDTTRQVYPPYFVGGELKMMELIAENLNNYPSSRDRCGDMEVAFTVERSGRLSHVEIVKGVDEKLDARVQAIFKLMEWKPANVWEDNFSKKTPFACECVFRMHFPMITH